MEKLFVVPIRLITLLVFYFSLIGDATANSTLFLTGEVAAKNSEVFYAPRVTGWQTQIEWMMPEGQIAKAGELVVLFERSTIDSEIELKESDMLRQKDELALAKSDASELILQAQFDYDKAVLELDKGKIDASVSREFVSLYDFEKAAIDYQKKKLAVEKSQRQLHTQREEAATDIKKKQTAIKKTGYELATLQKKSHLTALKTQLGGPVIYASHPWNGTKITSGSSVQATWKVAEIASSKIMLVTAWLNEVDKEGLSVKQKVQLTFDAYNSRSYAGVVTHIVPQAEERKAWGTAAYFKVQIDISKSPNIALVPGMSVLVEVL
jgi:multidrug resistance efflux pump